MGMKLSSSVTRILIGFLALMAVSSFVWGAWLTLLGCDSRTVGAAFVTAAATIALVRVTIQYARSTGEMAEHIRSQLSRSQEEFETRFSPQILLWAGPTILWSGHRQSIELDLQNIRDGGADSVTVRC